MNAQQISWLPEEVRNHIAQLERDLDRVTAERDHWIALYKERDKAKARCIEREERIDQMGAAWDKTKADLARVTAERDHWIALYKERNKTAAILEDTSIALRARVAELEKELDWQNMPNRREPLRGGYEFFINEEWSCVRDAALGEDVGSCASLLKVRYDPDDERVRIRRVLDDDAILADLKKAEQRVAELEKEAMILRGTVEAVTTQRQQAEQRVAELVAALRNVVAWTEPFYAHEVRDFESARDLLARAESAAQEASK